MAVNIFQGKKYYKIVLQRNFQQKVLTSRMFISISAYINTVYSKIKHVSNVLISTIKFRNMIIDFLL